MSEETLLLDVDARGVATLTLNRPDIHNAFDDALIGRLADSFNSLSADPTVRVIVLAGAGRSFSAGADLNWMKSMVGFSEQANMSDAMRLARMLEAVNGSPKPTVARVHGAAIAGAVGLVCCCDVAIAAQEAQFGVSEARIGLIPATISPYVIAAMGQRNARRYFLTAERFGADQALAMGLVHEVVPGDEIDAAVAKVVDDLLLGGPEAIDHCKRLIRDVAGPVSVEMRRDTAARIAERRVSDEGQEGLASFLEKRRPNWVQGS